MPQTPKEVLLAFGETTSVKGVSRVLKAKSKVTQAFWVIAVVVCFSALLYNVLNNFASYFNYDINTVTRLNATSPLFPLVTVCNMNPYTDMEKFPISYPTYSAAIDDMEAVKTAASETSTSRVSSNGFAPSTPTSSTPSGRR